MSELDGVSVEIGKLTTACKHLQGGHDDIKQTTGEIFTLMRGMDEKITKLSAVGDDVKELTVDVHNLKISQARRAGLQMGISGLLGGGVTLFVKKIFESFS